MGIPVHSSLRRLAIAASMLAVMISLSSCSMLYYSAMEKFGYEKREILVDRIKDGRDEQEKAKEEFADALERFQAVLQYDGGNLESQYRKLKGEYEDCDGRAKRVRERISKIEDVSEALFAEWEKELGQYRSQDLRLASERQLRETRRRYDSMIGLMQDAADKMDPVLFAFHDQVLFLKHNLNAQAIASLQGDVAALESEVAALIADMELSIAEADRFIGEMNLK